MGRLSGFFVAFETFDGGVVRFESVGRKCGKEVWKGFFFEFRKGFREVVVEGGDANGDAFEDIGDLVLGEVASSSIAMDALKLEVSAFGVGEIFDDFAQIVGQLIDAVRDTSMRRRGYRRRGGLRCER